MTPVFLLDIYNYDVAINKNNWKIIRQDTYQFQAEVNYDEVVIGSWVNIKRNGPKEIWLALHSFHQIIWHEQVEGRVDIIFVVLSSQIVKGTQFDTHHRKLG